MIKKLVSIQGEPGAFHHLACEQYFGSKADIIFRQTFDEVFEDVVSGKADFAIVASRSSEFGVIEEVRKLMKQHGKTPVEEIKVYINFCLLGLKDSKIEKVEKVFSQLPALYACKNFLSFRLSGAKLNEYYDTAGAAKYIRDQNNPRLSAVASKKAAEIYGLKILAENIGNSPNAHTYFYLFDNAS